MVFSQIAEGTPPEQQRRSIFVRNGVEDVRDEDDVVAAFHDRVALAAKMQQRAGDEWTSGAGLDQFCAVPFVLAPGREALTDGDLARMQNIDAIQPGTEERRQLRSDRLRLNSTSGGSNETELNELMVTPTGTRSASAAVTTATPVAN